MGILDSLRPRYAASPVDLEGVVGAWTAARMGGGLALSGGQIVLGSDYIVFSPWDMDQTRTWLVKALSVAGDPGWAGKLNQLITMSGLLEPVVIPLGVIRCVEPVGGPSLFKPPTARLHLQDGRSFDFGILASPRTPNFSGKNTQAFQDFMGHLPAEMRC
jgi:hypothetical protein